MSAYVLKPEELRVIIKEKGFSVRVLARNVGLSVRTLERRFEEQFRMSPAVWIMRERMHMAPPLLAAGLSNKEIAASLRYTCESNFCRDFKKHFGRAPQKFAHNASRFSASRFDKELSSSDNDAGLIGRSASSLVPWMHSERRRISETIVTEPRNLEARNPSFHLNDTM